jgi:hypothetical protein
LFFVQTKPIIIISTACDQNDEVNLLKIKFRGFDSVDHRKKSKKIKNLRGNQKKNRLDVQIKIITW